MKLVAPHPGTDREKGIFLIHGQGRVSVPLRPFFHAEGNRQRADHRIVFITDRQGFAQVDEASAFSVNRQACFGRRFQGSPESIIFGEASGLSFGKTTADV